MSGVSGVVTVLAGMILAIVIYFMPTFNAKSRGHHNAQPIFILNLLLGWTRPARRHQTHLEHAATTH